MSLIVKSSGAKQVHESLSKATEIVKNTLQEYLSDIEWMIRAAYAIAKDETLLDKIKNLEAALKEAAKAVEEVQTVLSSK